jgi:AmmeMemoRadiSam system protein A
METPEGMFTEVEKRTLIGIVKTVIKCTLEGKAIPKFRIDSPALQEKRGAFVTLKKHHRLRGCIGHIEARKPLYKTVEEMAAAAAFNDPRFPAVRSDEYNDLSIEISVLSPLKRIEDISEITVGIHGIYIVRGLNSGLLLPQVAIEYKWDRLNFLEETCYKAGLDTDAWKEKDTKIYIFSADVFGEE